MPKGPMREMMETYKPHILTRRLIHTYYRPQNGFKIVFVKSYLKFLYIKDLIQSRKDLRKIAWI